MPIFQIPHSKGPIPATCSKFICHMGGPSERHDWITVSYSTVKWKESDGWSGRYLEQTGLCFQIPYSECSWKIQKTGHCLWSTLTLYLVLTLVYMYVLMHFLSVVYSLLITFRLPLRRKLLLTKSYLTFRINKKKIQRNIRITSFDMDKNLY